MGKQNFIHTMEYFKNILTHVMMSVKLENIILIFFMKEKANYKRISTI